MDIAIQKEWEKKYGEGGNLHLDLKNSLEQMRPWINEMKSAFLYELQQSNLKLSPEEEKGFLSFIYLVIPESHFDLNAESPAKAVGPFQFTPSTAESYDLQITNNYDERKDPILSARACAKHLLDSYQRFGKDWRMALMDYNGGLTNSYTKYLNQKERSDKIKIRTDIPPYTIQKGDTLSSIAIKYNTSISLLKRANNIKDDTILLPKQSIQIPQKKQAITYEGMRRWQEKNINAEIQRLREKYEQKHKVRLGESLSSIAEKYSTTIQEIQKLNKLTSTNIQVDDTLRLPHSKIKFEKIIMQEFSAQNENFNYPGKFYAVIKIIEELELEKKNKPIHQYHKQYTLKKSDLIRTLRAVGKQKGINPNSDKYKQLLQINPAITNSKHILPIGAVIRIPTEKRNGIPKKKNDMLAANSNNK